ncbi:hypothetical protein RvY_09939 [Ramazzottius varieornatus]|uniref:Uncharacterized protein n=1 Tax=Ramazzottius varieornatus TaxID=947166 RepID=A0A1D1VB34_RAMVA|nr:hypothetical protein RvY_09939 [Ramazzottius varieornatus]
MDCSPYIYLVRVAWRLRRCTCGAVIEDQGPRVGIRTEDQQCTARQQDKMEPPNFDTAKYIASADRPAYRITQKW